MTADELGGTLDFLRAAEALKNTMRSGWTSAGTQESVAEHTWRTCLIAMILAGEFEGVDVARLLKMCIVHDLGEAVNGDVPAPVQAALGSKPGDERADLVQLVAPLPERMRREIVALWTEYEAAETLEARIAKGIDKLETVLQHTQGANPPDFDYRFNLDYGRRYTDALPLLARLRAPADAETARLAELAELAEGGPAASD